MVVETFQFSLELLFVKVDILELQIYRVLVFAQVQIT